MLLYYCVDNVAFGVTIFEYNMRTVHVICVERLFLIIRLLLLSLYIDREVPSSNKFTLDDLHITCPSFRIYLNTTKVGSTENWTNTRHGKSLFIVHIDFAGKLDKKISLPINPPAIFVAGGLIGIKTLRFILPANNKYNIDIRYGILIINVISIEGKNAMYSLDIQQSTSSTICPNQLTVLGEKSGKLSIIFDSELKRWVLLNKYGIDIEVWFTLIEYGK